MADNTNAFNQIAEEVSGTDILWDEDFAYPEGVIDTADLVFAESGDFATQTGDALIRSSILRRLSTAQGSYALIIEDVDGIKVIDRDYGNPAGRFLSEPMSSQWIVDMISALTETIQQEPRVLLQGIAAEIQGTGKVRFSISYSIPGEPDPFVTFLGVSEDGRQFTFS